MWRILLMAASGLIISACGGGIGSYEEGIEAQADVMMEMVSVLEDVDDQSSAEKAADEIESLGERLAEISAQLRELPQPSAEEMQDIMVKQADEMSGFQQDVAVQMMKLAQYPVLTEAWMRAMEGMF